MVFPKPVQWGLAPARCSCSVDAVQWKDCLHSTRVSTTQNAVGENANPAARLPSLDIAKQRLSHNKIPPFSKKRGPDETHTAV